MEEGCSRYGIEIVWCGWTLSGSIASMAAFGVLYIPQELGVQIDSISTSLAKTSQCLNTKPFIAAVYPLRLTGFTNLTMPKYNLLFLYSISF